MSDLHFVSVSAAEPGGKPLTAKPEKIFASKAFETQNSSQIWSKRLASTRPRQTVITRGFGKYKLVPGFGFGKTDIWIKDFDVFVSFLCFYVHVFPAANGLISVLVENSKRAQKQVALINGGTFAQNPGFGKL